MSIVITDPNQFISTVFNTSGNITNTDVTIDFPIPSLFYTDTVTPPINGKTIAEALAAITKLTIGYQQPAMLNDQAFGVYATNASPTTTSGAVFTNLIELTINNPQQQIGTAVFGVHNEFNTGTLTLTGATFPTLTTLTITGNTGPQNIQFIQCSEFFGAYTTNNANAKVSACSFPSLKTITLSNIIVLSFNPNGNSNTANNFFGAQANGSGTANAAIFTSLQNINLVNTQIFGNNFFGAQATGTGNISGPQFTSLTNIFFDPFFPSIINPIFFDPFSNDNATGTIIAGSQFLGTSANTTTTSTPTTFTALKELIFSGILITGDQCFGSNLASISTSFPALKKIIFTSSNNIITNANAQEPQFPFLLNSSTGSNTFNNITAPFADIYIAAESIQFTSTTFGFSGSVGPDLLALKGASCDGSTITFSTTPTPPAPPTFSIINQNYGVLGTTVTNANELITEVITNNNTAIVFNFPTIPTSFYNTTVTNPNDVLTALQAITHLTLGTTKNPITISDGAFGLHLKSGDPAPSSSPTSIFTNLKYLDIHNIKTTGSAIFGVHNESSNNLTGFTFPALKEIRIGCSIEANEFFGALTNNTGNVTAPAFPVLETIHIKSQDITNTTINISGNNFFGVQSKGSVSGSTGIAAGIATAPTFALLNNILFDQGVIISGNQFFGANATGSSITTSSKTTSYGGTVIGATFPVLENILLPGITVFGNAILNSTALTNKDNTANIVTSSTSGNQFFGAIADLNSTVSQVTSFPALSYIIFENTGNTLSGLNAFNGITAPSPDIFIRAGSISALTKIPTTLPKNTNTKTPTASNNTITALDATTFNFDPNSSPSLNLSNLTGAQCTTICTASTTSGSTTTCTTWTTNIIFASNLILPNVPISTGNNNYGNLVTLADDMITSTFDVNGNIIDQSYIINHDVPSFFYTNPTIINGQTVKSALQVLNTLTIGNGVVSIKVNDFAFSTSPLFPSPINFINLQNLFISSNVSFGNSVFGIKNTSPFPLSGALFLQLTQIVFRSFAKIKGSELFGAYSNNGGYTTAAQFSSQLQNIVIKGNVIIEGNNTFGLEGSNKSTLIQSNFFPSLSNQEFPLFFQSDLINTLLISGDQFFGTKASNSIIKSAAINVNILAFPQGITLSGNQSFGTTSDSNTTFIQKLSFPILQGMAFSTGIDISKDNTFNDTQISSTLQPPADICLQYPGITFTNTTFSLNPNSNVSSEFENLNGALARGTIFFPNDTTFTFSQNQNYGNSGLCNNVLPPSIVYTDLKGAATAQELAELFVKGVKATGSIRFLQDVPANFGGIDAVRNICPQLQNLSFGPGIKINNQAFGSNSVAGIYGPDLFELQTIVFEKGCTVLGDQVFGVYCGTTFQWIVTILPNLQSIIFEDNVHIEGDDLFGTSSSHYDAHAFIFLPALVEIKLGNNMIIKGKRVFGSTNFTNGFCAGASMPNLKIFEIGESIQFSGDYFLGSATQYHGSSSDLFGGISFGAFIGSNLLVFKIGNKCTISGDGFLGSFCPSGGFAFGAIIAGIQSFEIGDHVTISGGHFCGAEEGSFPNLPFAIAAGAYFPSLQQFIIGKNVKISGQVSFSAKRSGNPIHFAFPPVFGSLSASDIDQIFNNSLKSSSASVDIKGLTNQLQNVAPSKAQVSIGSGTTFDNNAFGLNGNLSSKLSNLEGASSDGNNITLSNGSTHSLAGGYDDTNGSGISGSTGQSAALLFLTFGAFILISWFIIILS